MRLLGAKKKFASLDHVEKKSQKVEDLVIKCNYKICISSMLNRLLIQSPILTYSLSIFQAYISIQIGGANYWLVNKKIDYLTEIMKDLAF